MKQTLLFTAHDEYPDAYNLKVYEDQNLLQEAINRAQVRGERVIVARELAYHLNISIVLNDADDRGDDLEDEGLIHLIPSVVRPAKLDERCSPDKCEIWEQCKGSRAETCGLIHDLSAEIVKGFKEAVAEAEQIAASPVEDLFPEDHEDEGHAEPPEVPDPDPLNTASNQNLEDLAKLEGESSKPAEIGTPEAPLYVSDKDKAAQEATEGGEQ